MDDGINSSHTFIHAWAGVQQQASDEVAKSHASRMKDWCVRCSFHLRWWARVFLGGRVRGPKCQLPSHMYHMVANNNREKAFFKEVIKTLCEK